MNYKDYAMNFKGCKQGDKKHKQIVDGYNKIKPLPRGYKVKYNDSWCATFVSFVMSKCGAKKAPYECSAPRMYNIAKKNKQVVKTPKPNDLIFYDWNGDNSIDHVGVIYKVDNKYIYTIEGNKHEKCDTRKISKNSDFIYGFARVPNKKTIVKKDNKESYEVVAKDVINGKYGNGSERKKNLEKKGYNYSKIQTLVNKLKKK